MIVELAELECSYAMLIVTRAQTIMPSTPSQLPGYEAVFYKLTQDVVSRVEHLQILCSNYCKSFRDEHIECISVKNTNVQQHSA